MIFRILRQKIVNVVGRDKRNAQSVGHTAQYGIDGFLLAKAVVL